jgi:hypothetical protein
MMAADDSAPAAAAGQEQGQSADVLITIRALLPNLAPVEQRVAQQVMKDPFGTAMQSISELARSCDTSATTVSMVSARAGTWPWICSRSYSESASQLLPGRIRTWP